MACVVPLESLVRRGNAALPGSLTRQTTAQSRQYGHRPYGTIGVCGNYSRQFGANKARGDFSVCSALLERGCLGTGAPNKATNPGLYRSSQQKFAQILGGTGMFTIGGGNDDNAR
jgi:hypothetical protein